MRYCKSTIFQANHNCSDGMVLLTPVVCDTAKVRFFKQITTCTKKSNAPYSLFAILQKYDFSSKSQPLILSVITKFCCLRYCKSTIFQANHNRNVTNQDNKTVVCDTAKVRFFKQITTENAPSGYWAGCLRYCKSTIFQANHNNIWAGMRADGVVCDTAKVRFFKQITTGQFGLKLQIGLFAILQKYDFSSKSQPTSV